MDLKKFKIENLDHYGRGISHNDGKIIFIENAMAGEKVKVNIYNEKKKYQEAYATEIIDRNKNRIEAECPYYLKCGGCQILHINYQEQLNFKKKKVEDILRKYMKEDISIDKVIGAEPFYYRNKATFQVKEKIGYYHRRTYEIIPLEKCLLVHPKINEMLSYIEKNICLEGITQIMIRYGIYTDEVMVVIKLKKGNHKKSIINVLKDKVTVLAFYQDGKYDYISSKKEITERLNHCSYLISPSSFFQVNTKQAIKLYDTIMDYVGLDDKVLDLYCGTGSIGIYISNKVDSVLGVEINESAIKDALRNKELNHISNIEFICKDVSKLKRKYHDINTIIVDPPRFGIDKQGMSYIMDYNANKLIYVSCDPMTMVRDLNILKEKYNIEKVILVDMFPNTYHVECCSLLCLKNE